MKMMLLVLALFLPTVTVASTDSSETLSLEDEALLVATAHNMGFRNSYEFKAYFEILDVTVTEDDHVISPSELALSGFENFMEATPVANAPSIFNVLTNLGADFGDVKKWITLGQKVWDVIKDNQPIANVATKTISILPPALPDWRQMETWKGPQAKSYTITARNLYGMTVISQTYTVAFHYGGSVKGRGQFLANATILPTNVDVSWGFTLNSSVKVGEPLNTGTAQDPVPGVDLGLEWGMSSILKKMQGLDQFYVRGDGTTSHVNSR